MEKPHVRSLRKIFLKRYMDKLVNPDAKPCVYLDETWVFQNGTIRRSWQDEDVRSVFYKYGYLLITFLFINVCYRSIYSCPCWK
jgi:hypothetical protein